MATETWSIAGLLRKDLKIKFPDYDWYNKSQTYKDSVIVRETGKSVRTMLYEEGQRHSAADAGYWVRMLISDLNARLKLADGPKVIAIDDVRKVEELRLIRAAYPETIHFHVVSPGAIAEPEFQNVELAALADYTCQW